MKLDLTDDTCGVIHERLEQAVEDLSRWITGGKGSLPDATVQLLTVTLEEVTDAYNDFTMAWMNANDEATCDD